MKSLVGLIFYVLFLSSCSVGIHEVLARSQEDPYNFEVSVLSFRKENEIKCQWEGDQRCDEYILMRSEDKAVLEFREVYRGGRLSYRDKDVREEERYVYRLDKRRGEKVFKGRRHFLGVCNKSVHDIYENNDERRRAFYLDEDAKANLFYYRSYGGEILEDDDWYKVRVPGHRKAYVSLQYKGAPGATVTPFKVLLPYNSESSAIANQVAFEIENVTGKEDYFYFKIHADDKVFLSNNYSGGGRTEYYTLRLVRIE